MRLPALLTVLALGAGACLGGNPAVSRPALPGFEPRRMVDVLAADDIPPLDRPSFLPAEEVRSWLGDREPVVLLEVGGEARAYPLQVLVWHEIVNDAVGGRAVAVTFCPLCDAAVVFDRAVKGRTLRFASSGKLYRSNLVMYDRETESLWPQMLGTAVRGELKGATLRQIPSGVVSFAEFRAAFPGGRVLSRETGFRRSYGITPYPRYDSRSEPFPSFFLGHADGRLPAMERVAGIRRGGSARAYPYGRLAGRAAGGIVAVGDRVGGRDVVVLWKRGRASALDAPAIAEGREVGQAAVFSAALGGRTLRFAVRGGRVVDAETGSTWDFAGRATAGPLRGSRLARVASVDALWFSWAAFTPHTEIWDG